MVTPHHSYASHVPRKFNELDLFNLPTNYLVDVLWGQPIKLSQVASTSEWLENQRNNLVFFKIIPSHFCRASEASKIDCFKN